MSSTNDIAPKLLLARHVHLCLAEDHPVLLDLRNDVYLALGRAQSAPLAHLIEGWPQYLDSEAEVVVSASPDSPESTDLLKGLVNRGLVTKDRALGRPATPVQLLRPESTLPSTSLRDDFIEPDKQPRRVRLHSSDWWHFFQSYWTARFVLRRRLLERAVARAQERKERHAPAVTSESISTAAGLVDRFDVMRRFVYTKRSKCLLDSFVLTEFLSHYGIFPIWVFGVATGPFAAHSWVQDGEIVFNDIPERVRRFTPILAV